MPDSSSRWVSWGSTSGLEERAPPSSGLVGGHQFHIPVMGTGFTIDTPIRVAPLGLHSAISLVSDSLIEAAREEWCQRTRRPFRAVPATEREYRSERIRAYLDLVQELVDERTATLRTKSFFEPEGPSRYFELLPTGSTVRQRYLDFLDAGATDPVEERALRSAIRCGRVDVNVMTRLDRHVDRRGRVLGGDETEALAAARGFLSSSARGALILSAGASPRLFAYLREWPCLWPDGEEPTAKQVILKASDFRSASLQGRMLARGGVWVSEFRIESGLNSGGHTSPTEGRLLGVVLEEFRTRREELHRELWNLYSRGLRRRGIAPPVGPPPIRITVQGGLGTHAEHRLALEHYGMDSTGWGTPFLMVPEVVRLDEETEELLLGAQREELLLSRSSPLDVRFWNLANSPSERVRKERIRRGVPGSPCEHGHFALDCSYGAMPLCHSSRAYQRQRLAELDPNSPDYPLLYERVTAPACLCHDLGGAYLRAAGGQEGSAPPPAVSPGPNLINFQGLMTLEALVGHIYGRCDVLTRHRRPHFLLREAELYLDVLEEELSLLHTALMARTAPELQAFIDNLRDGLASYRRLADEIPVSLLDDHAREGFCLLLERHQQRLVLLERRLQARRAGLVVESEVEPLASPLRCAGVAVDASEGPGERASANALCAAGRAVGDLPPSTRGDEARTGGPACR